MTSSAAYSQPQQYDVAFAADGEWLGGSRVVLEAWLIELRVGDRLLAGSRRSLVGLCGASSRHLRLYVSHCFCRRNDRILDSAHEIQQQIDRYTRVAEIMLFRRFSCPIKARA